MLTASTLDEGSSLGTIETDSILPVGGAAQVGNGDDSVMSGDSSLILVSTTKEGLLILDGVEDDEEVVPPAVVENNLQLSGADSVPTIVGSLDGVPPPAVESTSNNKNEDAGSDFQENVVANSPTSDEKPVPPPPSPPPPSSASNSDAGTPAPGAPTLTPPAHNNKSRLALFLIPTVAMLCVASGASVRMYRERSSLQLSISELEGKIVSLNGMAAEEHERSSLLIHEKEVLEAQLSDLQDMILLQQEQEENKREKLEQERDSLQSSVKQMESKVLDLRKEATIQKQEAEALASAFESMANERDALHFSVSQMEDEIALLKEDALQRKLDDSLNWNSCGGRDGDTILLDNCWFNAKANIRLGNCANDAKDAFKSAVKDVSSSLFDMFGNSTVWIDSSFAGREDSWADDDDSVTRMMRKVDSLGKKLWHAPTIKVDESAKEDSVAKMMRKVGELWNATSTSKNLFSRHDITGENDDAIAKMMRKVEQLWDASTTKHAQRGKAGKSEHEFPSFFSKMDVNGKSWFKESIRNMFGSFEDPSSKAESVGKSPDSLNEALKGISDIVAAASTLSVVAGETLMTKVTEAMEMNETSVTDLLLVARQAFQEASFTHAAAAGK